MRTAPVLLLALLALPALAQEGTVRSVKIHSRALGQERTVLVSTPPGYERSGERYPVLYFTDGDLRLPLLAATVRFLAAQGRIPELVLVGIPHRDRRNELTPTRGRLRRADGGWEEFPTSGGADRFLAFVETELVPWVEGNVRTAPFRILAGHSLGGLFALHTLHERPGLFQARIAVSPTLGWDGDLAVRRTRELVARRPDLAGSLVFTMGDEGPMLATAFRDLEEVLSPATRLRSRGFVFPDEDHGTVLFPSQYAALREIFSGWAMPVAPGDVGPRGGLAAVEAHARALSERLGYAVPVPEQALNMAGYQALRDGNPDEALRAFRRNVELHPASANAQDSLGEALEKAGDLERARDAYKRAWTLGDAAENPNAPLYRANYERVRAALDGKRP
jgi:predicted alpha/beta superfamily hydrolase